MALLSARFASTRPASRVVATAPCSRLLRSRRDRLVSASPLLQRRARAARARHHERTRARELEVRPAALRELRRRRQQVTAALAPRGRRPVTGAGGAGKVPRRASAGRRSGRRAVAAPRVF